jgi:hypothetical protein
MKKSTLYYKIGAWSLVILGIGHLFAHISLSMLTQTAEQINIAATMTEFQINLLGTESNLMNFHNGYSLMMGILVLSYGLMNLILVKYNSNASVNLQPILILNSITALITCTLSIQLFFIVPIALSGIALVAFVFAYINNTQKETALKEEEMFS